MSFVDLEVFDFENFVDFGLEVFVVDLFLDRSFLGGTEEGFFVVLAFFVEVRVFLSFCKCFFSLGKDFLPLGEGEGGALSGTDSLVFCGLDKGVETPVRPGGRVPF